MKLGLRVIVITGMVGVMAAACASAHAGGPPAEAGTGPPPLTVLTHGADNGNGDIFIAPAGGNYAGGPEILSPAGRVIWFDRLPAGVVATDFRTQTYRGQPVLTWFQSGGAPAGRAATSSAAAGWSRSGSTSLPASLP